MNKEVMFSSKTDLWGTPQDLFDELDAEFHFDLDVCALPENANCERYYTPEQDGLFKAGTISLCSFTGFDSPKHNCEIIGNIHDDRLEGDE